ncbi:MAG: GNAT family N-acetyltransferase [Rhodococcus sp.]|uniref:GNAT family N-acetyltransferase n=1 Tax=Rhodococcus TaxID=1827 RepID=UPI0016B685CC|nr:MULTISPECIES: GNAT family N-acetyltransferase [Rhodococcus]NLV79252.1 GNAT family N-acetyltransferase [Rhodococcus sp. (in: high G+C Gram-positive bacteria)]
MNTTGSATTTGGRSPVIVERAGIWDAEAVADVAAATFPLACPPGSTREDIASFVDETLSAERFGDYLTDPLRIVFKACLDGEIVGYLMAVDSPPTDPGIRATITASPSVEISKLYVLPGAHGSGVAAALMDAIVECARSRGRSGLWLGVNRQNGRAQRFYAKQGFTVVGSRTFVVGTQTHADHVMQRTL